MSFNYIENKDSKRHINWMGLGSFFLLCLCIPIVSYLIIRFIAPDADMAQQMAIGIGVIVAIAIFTSSLVRTLRIPLENLPLYMKKEK
jgi:hypothetical protein